MTSDSNNNMDERDLKGYVQPIPESGDFQGITSLNLNPSVQEIIDRCYIMKNHIYIHLKKPKVDKVVATINKSDYTAFRRGLEKLLKEKGVDEGDRKKVLGFVDINHEIIYRDPSSRDKDTDKKYVEPDQSDQYDHHDIKNLNVSECIKLHSGTVKVSGNIVTMSKQYKVISGVEIECECGTNTKTFNPPLFSLSDSFNKCPNCQKYVETDEQAIHYRNAITVELQDNEKFNDIEKLSCILLDVDSSNIRVGERVSLTGNIRINPKTNKSLIISRVFADRLEYPDSVQIETNGKDLEAIKRFARLKGSSIIDSLVDLFDKSVIGNNIAKEALLYGLVSAGDDLPQIKKRKQRTRLNVLLGGNSGLGKSSLLKKTVSLIQNSRYETVQHSSAKSLTAIVSKENEQYFLRLGPIPMAKGSVCCLNEIGTMNPDEQNHLLDIMEEGEFTINKHGLKSTIKSPTVIIASTNLRDKNVWDHGYSRLNDTNQSSDYPLPLQDQLLDRFDMIVILKDNGDMEALKEYTEKKTQMQICAIPNYGIFLQKYIEYAKNLNPILSPEVIKMVGEYYNNLAQSNPNSNRESRRRLETIIRLCKAVAKLKLKDTVNSEDVIHATRFYNAMIYNYNGSKVTIPRDPIKLTFEKCVAYLKENAEPVLFTDLIRQACIESECIKSYLLGTSKDIEEHKLSQEKNKKVRRICDVLRSDKNVITVNKNPIKLQFSENNVEEKPILCRSERSEWSGTGLVTTQ